MPFADLLRLISAVEGGVLIPLCFACVVGVSPDQLARFAALGLIGVVVVGGQIDAWGRPGNWRLPILVVALALALYGVVVFLARRRRADRE